MPDNVDYLSAYRGMTTGANVNAAAGVPPSAALTAIKQGPNVGIDPSLAMHDPAAVDAMARDRENQAMLAASPPLQNFVGTSPAHAAVAQHDYGALGDLAIAVSKFTHSNQLARDYFAPGEAAWNQLYTDYKRASQPTKPSLLDMIPGFSQQDRATGSMALDTLGIAGSMVSGTINAYIARPLSYIPQTKLPGKPPGPFASSAEVKAYYGQPKVQVSQEERQRGIADLFNFALLGLSPAAGLKGAGAAEAGAAGGAKPGAPPPPDINGGPAAPHPETGAPQFTPEGFVADAEGKPATFSSMRDAANFIFRDLRDEPGEFKPYNDNGVIGIQKTPGSEANWHKARAESDATGVADMEEQVASTQFHSQAPELTEEYLNHTEAADHNVHVDPNAIIAARDEGHDPFPNMSAEIQDALVAGREVQMPLSSYLADVSGKPYAEQLRAATRFRDNGMSVDEAANLKPKAPFFDLGGGGENQAFIAKPNTLDTNAIEGMLPLAQEYGGRYAVGRANTAFQFESEAKRQAFLDAVGKEGLAPTFEQSEGPAVERRATPRTPESEAAFNDKVRVQSSQMEHHGDFELATLETPNGPAHLAKPGTMLPGMEAAAIRAGGRYAMGKAKTAFQFPTVEKRNAFLKEVGQAGANVTIPEDIPPEMHDNVRTYAASVEAAVDEVFNDLELNGVFEGAEAAGLTKRQFERYDNMIAEAKADATDRILDRLYNQIRRERTPEWKTTVEQHMAAAEQELAKVPVLQAYSQLTRGKGVLGEPLEVPFRLSTDDDIAQFGKDLGLPQNMFRKNGLTADQVASDLGFESGAGMMRQLKALHDELDGRPFSEFVKNAAKALAEERAREELGFDISPEGIMEAVHEEAVIPKIEDFLGQTVKDLQAQVGDRSITLEDIKAQANDQFERMPVKQASNPKVFERGIKRTGEQALRALEKSDFGKALGHRIQQLLNFHQLKLSWAFKKEFERGTKQLKRWGKNEAVAGTDPLIGAILQRAAMDLGYEGGRDEAELQRGLDEAKAAGRVSTMPEAVGAANDNGYNLIESPLVGDNAATPKTFRAMMNMLTGVAKFGKELNEVHVGAKQWELTALGNEVQANAGAIGRKYTPDQLLSMRDTLFGRLKGRVKSILINNLRPEVPLYFLDGEKQGPIMRSVVNPLMEGKYMETDLINDWIKSMRDGVSSEYLSRTDKKLDVPDNMMVNTVHGPAHVLKTEGQYRTALMYLGSDTARAKLLDGFGWGEAEEKWLLDRATAEDKRFVQSFWDQNEKLFNLADAMYRRVRGYGLVKDEPRAVHFPDGTSLPGGHIHVTYDPVLKVLQQISEIEGEDLLRASHQPSQDSPLDDDHPIRALPSAFYGLERTGFVGPVNLDARALAQGVKEVIHDISFREPLQAAQKVLFDPRVREAIMSVLGPDYGLQISPWLHYIAKERTTFNPATAAAAQMIRDLSSNFVFAKVAFNLSSTIKHSTIGISHMIREAGDPAIFAKAAQDIFTNDYWVKFIDQMSGEVRGLAWNMDTNLQEALARDALTGGMLHDARQLGFYLFTLSKRKEGQITWLATFRREVAKNGKMEDAVQAANKAVRDTQGASASVDLPTLFRKGDDFAHEIMRNTLGLLMGFRNTVPNRLWTANRLIGQAAQGKGGAGKAGSIYMTYVLGAALLLALYDVYVRGGGKAKKSKAENFAEEFGWGVSEQTLGSIMGLNKVEEAVHYGSDSDFSRLVEDGKKLMEGNPWGEQQWTDTAKMVGGATGIVPDSAVNFGATVYDTATGQVDNPASFIQRGVLGRQGNEGGSGTPSRGHRAARAHRAARGGGHK